MNELDFSAELSIQLQTYPISASGSAAYLSKTKTYFSSESFDVQYQYIKGSERVDLNQSDPDPEMIKKCVEMGATHVVLEVIRGGRAFINYE